VGGSAGGLDAYIRLLRHLPADMGVAIVIVNHVRTVATLLHEILPQFTEMPAERDLYRRILLDGKIKGRYLGMDAKAIPIFFASVAEKGIPLYQNNQQLIEPREQTDGATPRRVCFVASESPK
jgi:hypothetical protein